MVQEEQGAGEPARRGGEPDRQGLSNGAVALEAEVVEGQLTRSECAAEAEGLGEEGDAEIREECPHGAPAPGEDAGPSCVCGVAEEEEDDEQKFVGERADSVPHGGGASALGGDLISMEESDGRFFLGEERDELPLPRIYDSIRVASDSK
ncbi:hypothetical protein SORBI_3002G015950 [Sorghum bicolor]|uniref:Uncharacterized protein n=1 Tax=Sorghum bicolor TaxID=4558 RepID=A0A1W0W1T9_SORBI|nr:hypothetical protein SORBI_3002G015950 [Sorghum bicolor]